jgi:hypothetical protein
MFKKKASPAWRRTSASVRLTAWACEVIVATSIGPTAATSTCPVKTPSSGRTMVTRHNAAPSMSLQ